MNGSSPHLPEAWLSRLGGADASGWLTAFQRDAEQAVSDLLWNRFYFGSLNLTERGQLLDTWLEAFGDSENFAPRLDSAFAAWIEKNWGRFEQSAASRVSAWTCLASVIEFSARLPQNSRLAGAAAALRARFPQRERFLGSFSTAPAADPLGFYLAAVAEFQGDDRSLAGFWQRLCDLPDGVPFYHARYAILGLRRLKAENTWENGSLRAGVVLGALRLATAFDRLVRERGLAEQVAKSTFRRVAVQLAAAYPNSPGWRDHGLAHALEMPRLPQKWALDAIRPLADAVRQEQASANPSHARPRPSVQPDPAWADRVEALATELHHGRTSSLPEIERLLDEQRRYAEATGETFFVVRSLCNFASRILQLRPDIAGRWAEEARCLEPHNGFTWTTIRDVLLKQKNVLCALRFGWVAWKRFPENVVARTGLAEVLKAAERYPEATEVYRQTIERFPENVVARGGLADTLHRACRWDDAETTYRESIAAGYVNGVIFVGLAYLLRRKGEAGRTEALALVDEALRLDWRNPYALDLRQKLQLGHTTDVAAITGEWEAVADEILAAPAAGEEADDAVAGETTLGDLQFHEPSEATAQSLTFQSAQSPAKALPVAPPAKPLPIADSLEVSALIAEANFFRSWSAHCPESEALAHREKAAALLAKADALSPQDPQVAAEKAALEWVQGNHEQVMQTTFMQLGNHPAAAPLLVLKARLDREAARREQRQLSAASLAELLQAPNRLRDIAPALMPVFHLEKGLAALALLDGAVRLETAATAFTGFRRTVARWAAAERLDREASRDQRAKQLPRFHEWLQTTTNRRFFGTLPDPELVQAEDLRSIEQSLANQPSAFDEIEDTIVDRIVYAGV